MPHTIWHVDVIMNPLTDGVVAEARLIDGSRSVRAIGHAATAVHPDGVGSDYTLAAARSLEALSGVLGDQVEMNKSCAADQA